jgi:hypothetical protein
MEQKIVHTVHKTLGHRSGTVNNVRTMKSAASTSAFLIAALLLTSAPRLVTAEPANNCRVVDVNFTPSDKLQIVAWIEDTAGNYVDTIFITESIGTYGVGNRPGIKDFNSAPKWPYGRREMVFPIWAHRHGYEFPLVVYQNSQAVNDAADRNLSHPFNHSSREAHFCRPIARDEPSWDTGTCASQAFSDKGMYSPTLKSKYPPREDLAQKDQYDSPSVAQFAGMNPFDAVSQATPPGGVPANISWPIPKTLSAGNYVMMVETSKEFDHNASYTPEMYPAPADIPWNQYGEPFRGQPSVVYKVPFTISTGAEPIPATVDTYAGYGDPDGADGNVRPPDSTISTDRPGSGASRLSLTSQDGAMYRVRVSARAEIDNAVPSAPSEGSLVSVDHREATVAFVAPGDDGLIGRVTGYEVKLMAGGVINEQNFTTAMPASVTVTPDEPGQEQLLELKGLLPETEYSVGVRAYDDCGNQGALLVIPFKTTARLIGEVDACFIATAAYGSLMANDVETLRRFRDSALRKTVLGELFVESYYTFGPAVAGVVGESEILRATARTALQPLVNWSKKLSF